MMPLRITLVQTEQRWQSIPENLQHFSNLLHDVADTDLVVLPEMFTTGFSMNSELLAESMNGSGVVWMRETAKLLNVHICGSLIVTDEQKFWNRLVWASPAGDIQTYDKRHLFRMANEQDHYSPGNKREIFALQGLRVCPLICYDLRFPVWSRNNNDYDLLIYVANWPASRGEHWRTLLRARAIENQCYTVGVNRIGVDGNSIVYQGDSAVIDFKGESLLELGEAEALATVTIDRDTQQAYRSAFPAYLDADDYSLR